jgi:hypothetical protein
MDVATAVGLDGVKTPLSFVMDRRIQSLTVYDTQLANSLTEVCGWMSLLSKTSQVSISERNAAKFSLT